MVDGIIKFDIEIEQKRLAKSSREVLQKFKALDRAFDKLSPKGMTKVDASMKKASRTAARLNAEVRGASGQMNNLGHQAQITAKRFLVYNVIARFFFALANAIQEGTAAFISFDQELNKARQILNPLITDFDQFTKSIFELADAFGVTVKEVQAAQEVFIRQGKTQAQVTELTSQSLALAAAAGIEFAQATEAITASLNQFTGQGLVAVDIADKFTAVSIRSAVTADDLAQAIFRAGSAAATVGVNFDNLIGFITAAQEATRRGGRVIGTGLRTIFTRIFRAPSIAAMQELGIETRKTTGEFKNADHLIAALADRFTTLSQTQQIAIASTIAGQRQVATLLALLRNFEKAQDAANDSVLSQGEAARLVRIRQEALSFQIQKITNQFVKFGVALGEVFSGPIIDEVAGIADNFAVFASIIESTGPALGLLASSLSTVSVLLVAQLLGLGKVGGAYANYKKSVQTTREEIAAFRKEASAKELSAAGQSGGFLNRKANKFLGPTKQLEAAATEFKLKKQVAAMDKLISRERNLQQILQGKANVLQEEEVFLKERSGAIERANNNISNTGKTISETKLQLDRAILDTKEAIANIKPSKDALNNLKAENKLIKANIKDRQTELANIIGSRGAGRGTGGKRGQQNLAKTGLSLERDRVKIATEVLRLEDKIAILKGKHGLKGVLTEQQRARVLQQLDEHTGNRNRKRAALREDAARKEVKSSRDVARANLDASKNLQKQTALSNRIAQQQRGVTAAKQAEVSLSQQIASLNEFIANTEGTIAILNYEIEASKIRQAGAGKGLSNIERKQLGLLEAKLDLEKAIKLQKEKTAAASKREQGGLLSRSGRGIGGGIAASIGFNLAAEGIRELKKEGDKTTESIATGFESAGGIAVTAMLLPLGPLSLAIIAMQAIIGLVKVAKVFTVSWADASKKIHESMDKLTNTLRANKTIFKELSQLAGEIQLKGLSIINLTLINEKIEQMRKNFGDIDSAEFEKLMGDARKAVRTNNADGLARINKQLDELAGKQILSDNIIPKDLLEKQKEATDEALRFREILDTPFLLAQKDVGDGFGLKILTKDAEEANAKLKQMRADGKESTNAIQAGFIKASKSTESFSQAADRLNLRKALEIGGFAAQANEQFLRVRKGFDITSDASKELYEANRNNPELFQQLTESMDRGLPTIQAARKALNGIGETAGKSAVLFFEVRDAMNPLLADFKRFATLIAADTQGDVGAEALAKTMEVLKQSLIDGKAPIRGYIDDTGELVFKIQGIPGVIGRASKAYRILEHLVERHAIVIGVAESALDTFGDTQLSNARVTELLAQRYTSLANSVKATTEILGSTKNAMNEIVSLNSKLASSFPEKALDVNLGQMEALKDRAAGLGAGLEISINALSSLDEAMNIVRGTLGTRITDAFHEGGNASIDWATRLEVANEVVDDMGGRLERLSGQITGTNFGGGQFTEFKAEIFNLTKELVAIEKLSGAVLGLAALREKLLATDKGLLEDDTALLRKFEAILAEGFEFSNIDIGLASNKEIADEITRVLDSLSSTFRKKGAGIMGRAAQKLSVVVIEKMNTTLSTGGDTLSQRLDTILTQAANKIADKLQEPINELRQNLGALEQESIATLNSLVQNAESNLKTLGDIIGKGIIPPEKTLTDILVGQFVIAEKASEVALGKIQKRLGQLKADNLRLIVARDKAEKTNKDDLNRGEKIRRAREAVDASNAKVLEFTLKETAELKKQETLRAQQSQVLIQSIKQVDISFKNVISAQNAVATTEEKIFKSRLDFIDQEDATIGRRLSILKLERETFEDIRRSVSGIEQSDVSAIGDQIVKLTKESIAASFTDTASSEFIKTRIAKLQEQFNVEKQIGEMRIKSLQAENDLLQKQEKQIKDLGLAFLKSTTEQQKGMIGAARLTEKFFGGIGSGKSGPNTNQVKSSILTFLKNSDDKTRQSVIGQLERLKAAGGEVAPGVPAAKILGEMGKIVGTALFKNPAIAIAERQEKIQANILSEQKSLSEIARVQLRISAAAQRSAGLLSGEVAKRIVATQKPGSGGNTLKNLQLSNQSLESAARQADRVIAKEQKRVDVLAEETTKMDSAAVSNKRFVDATRKVDTAIGNAGMTMEEFQRQSQDLRTALVEADDAFIDAQQGVTDASNGVLVAFGNAAKAQAEYTIGIAESTRQNLLAVGGFQTYREELNFVTATYKEQINALQQVGATEQHIAALRVELAKEQLSIFEAQISNVRSNARALLTQEGAGLDFFNAGAASAAAASIASELGITPGGTPTGAQQDELAKAILGLPLEMRQDLDKAFSSAPPGQTAGGFGLKELETLVLSALGGSSGATPDLLSLEKQAAQQRFIIAENSTSQLESSRTATIAALDQLATAREALMEAQANKELARMQLDSLESELPQQTHLLSQILDTSTSMAGSLRSSVSSVNASKGIQVGTALELMGGNAARGTLSGSEVAGLLHSASREKGAMPAGSNLGVFNTSETVLTRAQMSRLRGGKSTPNAAGGTGIIGGDNIVSLLQEIANRVAELRQGGITQKIDVTVENNRRVNIEGLAGLQTALRDIVGDATGDLYTREEAAAIEQILQTILIKLRETGQVSAIGT